jgi:ATP-binding cassette subfamily F protein 3
MLAARGLRKGFGPFDVLDGVEWGIPPGSRWGLVGANGSGKTTLLRILAGEIAPDAGEIQRPGASSAAYLPQEGGELPEGTLLEAILSPFTAVAAMESEIARLHHAVAEAGSGSGPAAADLARRLGDLQHRFEAAGGFTLETEARVILSGLGFAAEDAARPLAEFSGGFRMRALLGSLLLRRPDYLLLDEPTNHLDLDGIGWLEAYLARLPSALVVVSHDRLFLNRLVESVAELERGRLRVFRGDYDRYREEKRASRERAGAAAAREAKRRAEVGRFVERFRSKATKARQVQDRIRMLQKMPATEVPAEEAAWGFSFPPIPRPPRLVLEMRGVAKAFGGAAVLRGADLTVERGDRVALIGPNGCGKTTLLRIASGLLAADDGDVGLGEGVSARYAAQHVLETLIPGRTVLEELQDLAPSRGQGELRSLLGIFQFSGEDVFKKVERLSGGEKNRLALARLVLDPGNFLLLDEPTNHLDFTAREALEDALQAFEGAVLFASHDRYFVNRVATRAAWFEEGRLKVVDGGYDAYVEAAAAAREDRAEPSGAAAGSAPTGRDLRRLDRRTAAEARNARNRVVRELRGKVGRLEAEIVSKESRLAALHAALADPATYRDAGAAEALGREQKALEAELPDLLRRWEAATAELQAVETAPETP